MNPKQFGRFASGDKFEVFDTRKKNCDSIRSWIASNAIEAISSLSRDSIFSFLDDEKFYLHRKVVYYKLVLAFQTSEELKNCDPDKFFDVLNDFMTEKVKPLAKIQLQKILENMD